MNLKFEVENGSWYLKLKKNKVKMGYKYGAKKCSWNLKLEFKVEHWNWNLDLRFKRKLESINGCKVRTKKYFWVLFIV